jgi:hypothetical protein
MGACRHTPGGRAEGQAPSVMQTACPHEDAVGFVETRATKSWD